MKKLLLILALTDSIFKTDFNANFYFNQLYNQKLIKVILHKQVFAKIYINSKIDIDNEYRIYQYNKGKYIIDNLNLYKFNNDNINFGTKPINKDYAIVDKYKAEQIEDGMIDDLQEIKIKHIKKDKYKIIYPIHKDNIIKIKCSHKNNKKYVYIKKVNNIKCTITLKNNKKVQVKINAKTN